MDFVTTRRVGSALVTLIREGTGRWAPKMQTARGEPVLAAEWRQAAPGVDASGAADISLSAVLVRLGTATVLVDCCLDDLSLIHI